MGRVWIYTGEIPEKLIEVSNNLYPRPKGTKLSELKDKFERWRSMLVIGIDVENDINGDLPFEFINVSREELKKYELDQKFMNIMRRRLNE